MSADYRADQAAQECFEVARQSRQRPANGRSGRRRPGFRSMLSMAVVLTLLGDACHFGGDGSRPSAPGESSTPSFYVSARFGGGRGGGRGGRGGGGQDQGEGYYALLGVGRDADSAQIKKAFKKRAIKYHPDKNKEDPEAAKAKFQKIALAYETLSDADKRRAYDQGGEEAVR